MEHRKVQQFEQHSHSPKYTPEAPHHADRHVGRQVAIMRLQARTTQQTLAAGLGISVQQLQKYEKAKNRISASMLFEIGRFFDVPVSRFYEGLPGNDSGIVHIQVPPDDHVAFAASAEGQRLTNAYLVLPPHLRQRLTSFVSGLSDDLSKTRQVRGVPSSLFPFDEEGDR